MKYFVTFLFIALLCQNSAEAQTPTYAGLPGPENVLVVYKIKENQQNTLGFFTFGRQEVTFSDLNKVLLLC